MRFDYKKFWGDLTKPKKAPSKGKGSKKPKDWTGKYADWVKGGKRGKDLMKP